jgi:Protein of unknown function (DUF1592)/Protein of unknown function (DUF1588)/Protein of unknown function (DUF1585)
MTNKPSAILLVTLATVLGNGCGNRLLVGDNPDASSAAGTAGPQGTAGTAGPSGFAGAAGSNAGTGHAGTSGPAGATGTTPDGGLLPTDTRVVTPLPISANDALVRLSVLLWNDMPGADLMSQAALGHITTTEDLYGVVRQMLADPRAAVGVGAFYRWWLDLPTLATTTKDTMAFPAYTPQLQADMAKETETFGVNVTLGLNGSFQTLMTGAFSFINARLADIYGVSGVTGDTLVQTNLGSDRGGLLTQPALQALSSLATRNSPSRRGTYINERLLCRQIPPPHTGIPPLPTPAPAGVTVRAQLAESLTLASCGACHTLIDPPGLAFEGFDAIGRSRKTDNGAPVDTSNLTIILPNTTFVVDGPYLLAKALSVAPDAEDCMTRQWLSFAINRDLTSADDPWVADIDATFAASQYNLKELIAAVLTSGPFLAP